jgi:hypothetical protein
MLTIFKKILPFLLLTVSLSGFTQKRNDVGFLFSTDYNARNTLEFRHLMDNGYRFKTGLFQGNWMNYTNDQRIISSTDTSVSFENYFNNAENYGVRIGLDKQMGSSVFSFGGDLNLAYRSLTEQYSYSTSILNQDTGFIFLPYINSNDVLNNQAYRVQQFFVPSLRLSFMLDVPLGDAFLINFNVTTSFGMPIYVGSRSVYDPGNKFQTPASTFDFNTNFGLGLRYIIGNKPFELRKDKK